MGAQVRAILDRKRQAALPKGFPGLLGEQTHDLQPHLDCCGGLPRDLRHHRRSDSCWYNR